MILGITRGWTFLRAHVEVRDDHDRLLGGFHQRLLSIGGKFEVTDEGDRPVCMLQGKWTTWEFSFTRGETELARVTKKWAGLGRELLTTADNYVLEIQPSVGPDDPARPLIIAAVMCIDMVLKE